MFLMARLRFTHPKSFANALKMQNKTMTETYAIPLINTSPDEIFYLQPLLETTAGVIAVLPTRRTTKTGRYNILVKSKDFKQVRANIIQKFPTYYKQVSTDAQQNPDNYQFLGPPGIPSYTNNEDASSGAQSFLSTSAASFASFGDMSDTSDVYEPFTPATNTYSWSDVVKRSPSSQIPAVVSTPISSATVTTASNATSVLTPSEAQTSTANEIQNLRAEYELKLHSNTKEIGELKAMLNQVLFTLQNLGVQGVPNQQSPPPPTDLETCLEEPQSPQPSPQLKRTGSTSPPSQPDDTSRHKRRDHKPSPAKQQLDFQVDE